MELSSPSHPEVKRLRGDDSAPLLRVWHPQLGPLKGGDLVMDRELWIADYRLGFPSLSPVVANPHFVRRSERSVVPKSENMRPCGVCVRFVCGELTPRLRECE